MNTPTTVHNVFFIYRDGDSYLTASFIATAATLETARAIAEADTTRGTNPDRDIHVHFHAGRVSSDFIETQTDCTNGDYLILTTSVQGVADPTDSEMSAAIEILYRAGLDVDYIPMRKGA